MLDNRLTARWKYNQVRVKVLVEREATWEGAEAQIALTNPNGANNTAGLTIYNCNDLIGSAPNKRANYFDVAATSVTGDLPALARLELTNTYNNAARSGTIYLAHNVNSAPASLPHIIEGEAATLGTVRSYAAANSSGYAISASWSGAADSRLFSWALSTALLNGFRGNPARVLCRFSTAPMEDTFVTLKATASLTAIYESAPMLLSANILQELATLQLPPYMVRSGDLYPLALELWARHNSSGTKTMYVDFLQFSPVDSWRRYYPFGYNLGYQARLVDDGIGDEIYTDGWTPAGALGNYIGFGDPIRLIPGKAQRFYLLWRNDSGGSEITRTLTAKLYYRPRRLTL